MLMTGPTICDSRDGSCKYGCTPESGCSGETFRREYAKEHLQRLAEAVIKDAELYGLVVTIETEPTLPLRMGGHRMVASVREARKLAPTLTGGGDD